MNEKKFTREELSAIRQKALANANRAHSNTTRERAFWQLVDAADRLDAMIARTEEKED